MASRVLFLKQLCRIYRQQLILNFLQKAHNNEKVSDHQTSSDHGTNFTQKNYIMECITNLQQLWFTTRVQVMRNPLFLPS